MTSTESPVLDFACSKPIKAAKIRYNESIFSCSPGRDGSGLDQWQWCGSGSYVERTRRLRATQSRVFLIWTSATAPTRPNADLSSTLTMADPYPTLFRQSPHTRVKLVVYADPQR